MTNEEAAEALNPNMLLPVLAIANDVLPKGKLVRLPKVVSFAVLTFKSVVSTLDAVDTVKTEFIGATGVDPNLEMEVAGNEGAVAEVDGLLLEAWTMAVLPSVVMVAVVEAATLVKLFVKV